MTTDTTPNAPDAGPKTLTPDEQVLYNELVEKKLIREYPHVAYFIVDKDDIPQSFTTRREALEFYLTERLHGHTDS